MAKIKLEGASECRWCQVWCSAGIGVGLAKIHLGKNENGDGETSLCKVCKQVRRGISERMVLAGLGSLALEWHYTLRLWLDSNECRRERQSVETTRA
jgi:hypothetical protein